MTTLTKKRLLMAFVLVATTAILAVTYVANGSEKNDLWLYLTSVAVVFSTVLPELLKEKI